MSVQGIDDLLSQINKSVDRDLTYISELAIKDTADSSYLNLYLSCDNNGPLDTKLYGFNIAFLRRNIPASNEYDVYMFPSWSCILKSLF